MESGAQGSAVGFSHRPEETALGFHWAMAFYCTSKLHAAAFYSTSKLDASHCGGESFLALSGHTVISEMLVRPQPWWTAPGLSSSWACPKHWVLPGTCAVYPAPGVFYEQSWKLLFLPECHNILLRALPKTGCWPKVWPWWSILWLKPSVLWPINSSPKGSPQSSPRPQRLPLATSSGASQCQRAQVSCIHRIINQQWILGQYPHSSWLNSLTTVKLECC